MSNNVKDMPEYYLSHIVFPYRPLGWFQAPNHDDRNLVIRKTTYLQIWRDNLYYSFHVRDVNRTGNYYNITVYT